MTRLTETIVFHRPCGRHDRRAAGGGLSCQFEDGDGIDGSETYLGVTPTREACVAMAHSTQPTANGVTYPSDSYTGADPADPGRFYAEFGMTGNNGEASWQSCLMTGMGAPPPPPLPASLGLGQGEVNGCDWTVGLAMGGNGSHRRGRLRAR